MLETDCPVQQNTAPDNTTADGQPETGVFLVDKPAGVTSFGMVQLARRALGIKKVGHAGTLDPFATGLLIICAGRPATRIISQLMVGDKEYLATLKLGIETDTLDLEGEIIRRQPVQPPDAATVESCLAKLRGPQLQAPPAYSAVKHQGKPLYHYARKGILIEKPPRPIVIRELEATALAPDTLSFRVVCSKGTYIRVLAADIGKALGCGGHLIALRRTVSGPFHVHEALDGGKALADRALARQLFDRNRLDVEEALQRLS